MNSVQSSRRQLVELTIVVVVFAHLFCLLFLNLSDFTGLHRDEAWFGLNAMRIMDEGIFSIHGMNRYTSSLYSAVIAGIFKLDGPSIFNMRIISVICNYIGLIITAITSWRYGGKRAVWVLFAIAYSFPAFFLFSRLAWEVCAFNFLLISIQVNILCKLIDQGEISNTSCVVFFSVMLVGVLSHFVFISVAVSLFISILLIHIVFKNKEQRTLYQLTCLASLNLAMCIYIYILKTSLSGEVFQGSYGLIAIFFLLPALVSSFMFSWLCKNQDKSQYRNVYQSFFKIYSRIRNRPLWSAFTILLLLPLVYIFLDRHVWGFLGAITSTLSIQRILVYQLNGWEFGIFHLYWILVLSLFVYSLVKKLRRLNSLSDTQQLELLWYFYPMISLFVLSLFTGATASRHYLLTSFLLISCIPLVYKEMLASIMTTLLPLLLILFLGNVFTGQLVLAKSIFTDVQGAPFFVKYKAFDDYSHHFLRYGALLAHLKDQQICKFGETDQFIRDSLTFLYESEPYKCDRTLQAFIDYCPDCTEPVQYFSIQTSPSPPVQKEK